MSDDPTLPGTTAPDPAPGERTASLLREVERLDGALDRAGTAVAEAEGAAVREALEKVRGRLALGVDHTVVAMVGGTGSGKSSLFNALTGLDFADVGVRRPTTSQVTACVWAHDATRVLDWLGVSHDRRIERESELDGDSQADLRGLVLLDLPDHDSIEPEHRAVVDRLLPQADLLMWVVDPQKYADDALHTGYLRHLVGHERSMLVVLNQLDTVPLGAQAALMRDVDRLLREDGLSGVGVHGVSARTGDGLPVLRGVLADAVERRGVAEIRAAAELADAAEVLARAVGPGEAGVEAPRAVAVESLAQAVGLPGAVAGAARSTHPGPAITLGDAQPDLVARARQEWLTAVTRGLPGPWVGRLEGEVPDHDALRAATDEAVAAVSVRSVRSRLGRVWRAVAAMLGLATLVVVGLTIGTVVGVGSWTDTATLFSALGAAGVVGCLGLWWSGRVADRRAAARRASVLDAEARAALAQVVEAQLVSPTTGVLADHATVREVSAAAQRPHRELGRGAEDQDGEERP